MRKLKLTDKELQVMKSFIEESFACSGDFVHDNMSWMNDEEVAKATGLSRRQVAGLFGSLAAKGLIVDSGESLSGAPCNDYFASPGECLKYPALVEFIAEFE